MPGIYRFFDTNKFTVFVLSTLCSTVLLLLVTALRTNVYWFLTATVALIIFYTVVFEPIYIKIYHIPSNIKKYNFPLLCCAVTLELLALIASVEIYHKFNYIFAVGLMLYIMIPFFCTSIITTLKTNSYLKVGSSIGVFSLSVYFLNLVIYYLFGNYDKHIGYYYNVDFTGWERCITGNISIISLFVLIFCAAVLIVLGFIKEYKSKETA